MPAEQSQTGRTAGAQGPGFVPGRGPVRTGQGRPCERRFHQHVAQAGHGAVRRQKGRISTGGRLGPRGPDLCVCVPAWGGMCMARFQPLSVPHSSPGWEALGLCCPSQNSALL